MKQEDERFYYLSATKEQAWTRDILAAQISSNAYGRHCCQNERFSCTLSK